MGIKKLVRFKNVRARDFLQVHKLKNQKKGIDQWGGSIKAMEHVFVIKKLASFLTLNFLVCYVNFDRGHDYG